MRDDLEALIAKSPKQASVSTQGTMQKVLRSALEAFEDADTPGQAFRRALLNWHYSREENSKRKALDAILADTDEIKSRIERMEVELAELKAMIGGENDQDHA
jgi:hypothetical protein